MNSHMNRVLVQSIVNCVVSFWRQTLTQLLEVTAAQNSISDPTNSTALDKFYDKDQRREAGECRERLVSKTRSVCEKRRFVRKNPMLHGYKSNNSISMHSFRFNLWSLSLGDTPEVMRESPSKWSNWKPSFDKYHGHLISKNWKVKNWDALHLGIRIFRATYVRYWEVCRSYVLDIFDLFYISNPKYPHRQQL